MTTQAKIIQLKPHRATHTKSDTLGLTKDVIATWKSPPFQRPLRVNEKVRALVETIKRDGGVVPGVITLGVLGKDTYLLDGQHRIHAFLMTELEQGYCDVRIHHFDNLGDMGEEFVNLNSRLVQLRPDDILRGLEESTPALRIIREKCAFVGYDMIRRGERAPIVSMSAMLRCWCGSACETPASARGSAMQLGLDLTTDDATALVVPLALFERAWGRDLQYARLWGNLNLSLCFWLYRRLVVTQHSAKTPKFTRDLFQKCMMSLSADNGYLDWLVGRQLSERDRTPAYNRIKLLVAKRYEQETGRKPLLPHPAWAKGHAQKGAR